MGVGEGNRKYDFDGLKMLQRSFHLRFKGAAYTREIRVFEFPDRFLFEIKEVIQH